MPIADRDAALMALAEPWRRSGQAADLIAVAQRIPPGTGSASLVAALGQPLVVSRLSDGGETWLYIRSDPARGQFEALSIALSAAGGFRRLERKPIE